MQTQTTSHFETGLSKGAFLYLEEGTGYVSHVGTPPETI